MSVVRERSVLKIGQYFSDYQAENKPKHTAPDSIEKWCLGNKDKWDGFGNWESKPCYIFSG